jgi:hypothetical protein
MVIEPPEVRKAPYSIMNPGQNPWTGRSCTAI